MAIIPLRQYNREIESLIDTSQLDEAVAHCRHILETFPKHIATYRLLGKAYLEQQRFGDAADIFQRILSSVPDDQVANIGLSIIREDEGNLDAAIWYMERAMEAQPSNTAIKDELRRLYGRRDGIEPPKVRLTRGALARMYSRGGLYDQAIAELRAALADDPQRPDLSVLLAQMYFFLGQQVEAVDTCGNLMKRLPYCLVANRILASILPQTGRADDTRTYQQRVIAMDPYFASAPAHALSSDSVPDAAVNIERLAYRPGQAARGTAQPAWAASLGIAFEENQADQLPEWLQDQAAPGASARQEPQSIPTAPFSWESAEEERSPENEPVKAEDIIPDWMKEAGWQTATGAAEAEIQPSDLGFPSEQDEGEITKAEIPDWLKGLAPEGAFDEQPAADISDQEKVDLPWLQKSTPGASDTIVNWLGAQKPAEGTQPKPETTPPSRPGTPAAPVKPAVPLAAAEPGEEGGLPDWLQGVEASYGKSGITDWLKTSHLEEYEAAMQKKSTAKEPQQPEEELPDWLREMGDTSSELETAEPAAEEAAAPAEELPDWLREMGEPSTELEAAEPADEAPAAPAEELPAWLREMGEPAAELETAESPIEEPAALAEELPEWLRGMGEPSAELEAAEPAIEEPAAPAEELPAWLREMGEPAAELETAESAIEEPATLAEELPDWLKGMGEPSAELEAAEPAIEEPAAPAEELPAWLREMGEPAAELEATEPVVEEPAAPAEELPDWLEQAHEQATEMEISEPEAEEPIPPFEDIPYWLKETAELPPSEAGILSAEPVAEEPALPEIKLPEWLIELGQPEAAGIEATPLESDAELEAFPTEKTPLWLKETAELSAPELEAVEPAVGEQVLPPDQLPDWLIEMGEPKAETPVAFPDQTDQDTALAWLESLAAKHGAKEEELITRPEERPETIPDWIKSEAEEILPEEQVPVQPAILEEPALPAEQLPEWLIKAAEPASELAPEETAAEPMTPFIDQSEQEAALAWLEKLAAQHGAREEELFTKPEERPEGIPEWVKQEAEEEQLEAQIPPQPAEIEAAAHPAEELPEWLKEMGEPAAVLEPTAPAAEEPALPVEEIPEWMKEIVEPVTEPEAALPTAKEPALPAEELPEWLREMAEPAAEPEAVMPTFEETALPAEEIPEWLREMAEPAAEPEAALHTTEEPALPAEELPEWLREMAEPPAEMAPEEPAAEFPPSPLGMVDQDAALAWLEGLAAQHGAREEELITPPEERLEAMPDWVKQEAESSLAEEIPTQPVPVEGTALPAEELPDWLAEPAIPEEARAVPEAQAGIEMLPDWLEKVDQVAPTEGETGPSLELPSTPSWMPEAILPETELPTPTETEAQRAATLAQIETELSTPAPEPVISDQVPELTNINTASLSQLEGLPGIGFVVAQNIIVYRETNGLFNSIDDLAEVPGIDSPLLDNLRDQLTTGVPVPAFEAEAVIETEEQIFSYARRAVEQGEVGQAADLYNRLIAQRADFEQVIADMQTALYRYPLDLNFWQILGDGYLRTDKLQEALDAYTQAEELLR